MPFRSSPLEAAEGFTEIPPLRDGAAFPLLVFLALRVLISIVAVVFVGDHPPNPSAVGPGSPPAPYTQPATSGLHNAVDGMQRWDAAWFQWIAAEGYSPDDVRGAFFPGYPLLIRSTDLLTPLDVGESAYRASPDWSPDGRLVAFQSRIAGQFQLLTVSLRDRSLKQLTSDGSNDDPSWAPDGRHLVFVSNRSGSRQLWIIDAESGRTRQLTRGASVRLPAWSPRLGGN